MDDSHLLLLRTRNAALDRGLVPPPTATRESTIGSTDICRSRPTDALSRDASPQLL